MKTLNYILSLSLSLICVLIISGCSNPVDNSSNFINPTGENSAENIRPAILEFYVWKLVPVGFQPGVTKAYVDIYQGETFIRTIGATDSDGKFFIQSLSLPHGNYTAYAYTIKEGLYDYYGYRNFYNSGSSIQISIQVNHI